MSDKNKNELLKEYITIYQANQYLKDEMLMGHCEKLKNYLIKNASDSPGKNNCGCLEKTLSFFELAESHNLHYRGDESGKTEENYQCFKDDVKRVIGRGVHTPDFLMLDEHNFTLKTGDIVEKVFLKERSDNGEVIDVCYSKFKNESGTTKGINMLTGRDEEWEYDKVRTAYRWLYDSCPQDKKESKFVFWSEDGQQKFPKGL